jgi:hypothetical protein
MPLLYVPLIMYASWMEMMTQPFAGRSERSDQETDEERNVGTRKRA